MRHDHPAGGCCRPASASPPPSRHSRLKSPGWNTKRLAAVELGLSNSKLEGLNSKIRLVNHRGYGHHSAAALISMIYLCCGGITVQLPFS
ncbi:MAG: transposase [Candidatus Dormibacteria bacterium]